MMEIVTSDFVEGALNARGTAVIIDVFRAFSVACYGLGAGAEKIIPMGDAAEALGLRKVFPDAIFIGERHGRKLEGFDLGNSPSELVNMDVRGKTIIHTTHAGTQGLVNATGADEVLSGSLVNARATVDYILSKTPKVVSLVRMGHEAYKRTEEDDLCAEYLEALLLSRHYDSEGIRTRLRASACSSRFFDPSKPWSPEKDFEMCTAVDCFNFAVKAGTLEIGGRRVNILRPV